ncbi:glycosyltransferase family 2 protein [Burkholderia stabilis]|uniref:glycosyltransferase family 2 protein n=1 Tax=Burkholderia stabilis TaxID=95485 RepID=UPI001F4AB65B|nr:glycosyltransferase family 2 protein [Burkholderia stabilis]
MIVIPMVGLSSRFFKAGFTKPKFQLDLAGESVFARAVRSFDHYFKTDRFLFITRQDYDTPAFVERELARLNVEDYTIKTLHHDTRGQAETVSLGLDDTPDDEPLYIFNIDTFRYRYRKPEFVSDCDGYLEVFEGSGDHWSFVAPGPGHRAIRTTEKERISNLCSDGLYYFKRRSDFESALEHARKTDSTVKGEYYIAPLYNYLIDDGAIIKYDLIDMADIDFCGTPDEFELLKQQLPNRA